MGGTVAVGIVSLPVIRQGALLPEGRNCCLNCSHQLRTAGYSSMLTPSTMKLSTLASSSLRRSSSPETLAATSSLHRASRQNFRRGSILAASAMVSRKYAALAAYFSRCFSSLGKRMLRFSASTLHLSPLFARLPMSGQGTFSLLVDIIPTYFPPLESDMYARTGFFTYPAGKIRFSRSA